MGAYSSRAFQQIHHQQDPILLFGVDCNLTTRKDIQIYNECICVCVCAWHVKKVLVKWSDKRDSGQNVHTTNVLMSVTLTFWPKLLQTTWITLLGLMLHSAMNAEANDREKVKCVKKDLLFMTLTVMQFMEDAVAE